MKYVLCAFALQMIACIYPSQYDPVRYGTVNVAFGAARDQMSDWRSDQRPYLVEELKNMSALGPQIVETHKAVADLVVRPFDSGLHCEQGARRYLSRLHLIEIDPVCTPGYETLQAALGHEIGHYLGLLDICHGSHESGCDHRVETGAAVMNASSSYPVLESASSHFDLQIQIAQPHPTDLDLQEYRLQRR